MEHRPRILAIDDTPENLLVLRGLLRRENVEFLEATDPEEGLARARKEGPDLILLDVMMPGKDGFAVCRELAQDPATRSIPVIFITALTDRDSMIRGLGEGAVDYISKPFDPKETLARIRTHLRLRMETDARIRYQAAAFSARKRAILGDLMAGFAHNFNNLLVVVTGNLELAMNDALSPEERQERLGRALQASQRIAAIVSRITRYLRRETEPRPSGDEGFPLAAEVREIAEVFASSFPRRIRFEIRGDAPGIRAAGAPEEFRESLAALLQNALDAIPADREGSIEIEFERLEDSGAEFASVSVRDTGRGMDEETLARATTPFFSTKGTVGIGLGLTIAESYAGGCGGRLELESTPGVGTRATLVLPVAAAVPAQVSGGGS